MITITPTHHNYLSNDLKETFLGKYISILDYNKIPYNVVPYFNQSEFWESISKSSHFIARYRGSEKELSLMQAVLPEIERNGLKALPNFNTAYHCGDKSKLSAFYKANKIIHPNTLIFWEVIHLKEAIEKNLISFPVIVKLRKGAASTNVIKVYTAHQLIRLATKMFQKGVKPGMLEEAAFGSFYINKLFIKWLFKPNKNNLKNIRHKLHYIKENDFREIESSCVIVQEFYPKNNFDTRVTIIGNRAFAFRRFNRPDDFRASGSGMIDYNPQKIDLKMIEIAFEVSNKFGFQTMAYDFIYNLEGEPTILEHNFTYIDKAVAACPVFWDQNLNTYPNNNRLPQYWQLVDFLNDDKLKF
jgi:glutathione synthase/RimK-type ligase-like ATP-grasp enzyme